jgi:hypothetical protein
VGRDGLLRGRRPGRRRTGLRGHRERGPGRELVGAFNRDHGLFDLGNPHREIDDPSITAAFAALLDRVRPDVVHFHNLHNPGAACLHPLADSRVDGTPDVLAEVVIEAAEAAVVDLDAVADVDLLVRPMAAGDDDRLLHAAVDGYVPLHAACEGHLRHARAASAAVVELARLDGWMRSTAPLAQRA